MNRFRVFFGILFLVSFLFSSCDDPTIKAGIGQVIKSNNLEELNFDIDRRKLNFTKDSDLQFRLYKVDSLISDKRQNALELKLIDERTINAQNKVTIENKSKKLIERNADYVWTVVDLNPKNKTSNKFFSFSTKTEAAKGIGKVLREPIDKKKVFSGGKDIIYILMEVSNDNHSEDDHYKHALTGGGGIINYNETSTAVINDYNKSIDKDLLSFPIFIKKDAELDLEANSPFFSTVRGFVFHNGELLDENSSTLTHNLSYIKDSELVSELIISKNQCENSDICGGEIVLSLSTPDQLSVGDTINIVTYAGDGIIYDPNIQERRAARAVDCGSFGTIDWFYCKKNIEDEHISEHIDILTLKVEETP